MTGIVAAAIVLTLQHTLEFMMQEGYGVCPVCNGTHRMPCPDQNRDYGQRYGWYGYRAEDDTITCDNCGAQTMWGRPTGEVPLRRDGSGPCRHEYRSYRVGRCLTQYECLHCDFRFQIDSGD